MSRIGQRNPLGSDSDSCPAQWGLGADRDRDRDGFGTSRCDAPSMHRVLWDRCDGIWCVLSNSETRWPRKIISWGISWNIGTYVSLQLVAFFPRFLHSLVEFLFVAGTTRKMAPSWMEVTLTAGTLPGAAGSAPRGQRMRSQRGVPVGGTDARWKG